MTAASTETSPHADQAGVEPLAADDAPWLQRYTRLLVFVDLSAVLVASVVALLVRFGGTDAELRGGVPYALVTVLLPVAWLLVLAMSR